MRSERRPGDRRHRGRRRVGRAVLGVGPRLSRRTRRHDRTLVGPRVAALIAVFLAGIAIRVALFPGVGPEGRRRQVRGLGQSHRPQRPGQRLRAEPDVRTGHGIYLGRAGFLEPAFRTATDSSDPWIRSLMKVPASIADLGSRASWSTRSVRSRSGRW